MSDTKEMHREIQRRLAVLSVSNLSDAAGGEGVASPGWRRFSGAGTVAGRAVTADCAEGALGAVFAALESAQPGDVLCATAPGPTSYMGDLLATHLAVRGLAAAVVDGNIRDAATIAALPVSVFARGLSPIALRRREPGRPMVPIEIGGVTVHPGDWVVADLDGIIVIRPEQVVAALDKAEAAVRLEDRIMVRIQAGERPMDAVKAELGGA
jgi:regulator of RNase E activity RraA